MGRLAGPKKSEKNRDLLTSAVGAEDWLFFDQFMESPAWPGFQGKTNILSTETPTVFGGNLDGSVENRRNAWINLGLQDPCGGKT
ncbi:hypothetical protein [Pseudomonas citri]|uniref:hypothetical protein n=1 Tax=Pseudomonas citri TaxID=2978349 RepID=UPI0021B546F8|nr:hypothetical protein [Pseudomonas citri]